MRAVFLLAVLITSIFTAGCVQNSGNSQDGNFNGNVEIINFAYQPSDITIKVGDTVTWTNKDSVGHTVTSDDGNELDSEKACFRSR